MNLTPESQAKVTAALQPLVHALVDEIVNQASVLMIERLHQSLGLTSPTATAKVKKKPKKRQLSNGTGKKNPPRTDLNTSDKAVLKIIQKLNGQTVQTGVLSQEMPLNRSTITKALVRLVRYGLVERSGNGRNIAYNLVTAD